MDRKKKERNKKIISLIWINIKESEKVKNIKYFCTS